jgi:hypothetical protein
MHRRNFVCIVTSWLSEQWAEGQVSVVAGEVDSEYKQSA